MSIGVKIEESSIADDKKWKNPHELVSRTRDVFKSKKTIPLAFRKKQLKNLLKFIQNEEEDICKAMYEDLKKPKAETIINELTMLQIEIRIALDNIVDWTKPERVKKTIANIFDDLYIYSDPLGVVLVIGAWNYPIQLTLGPVVGKLKFVLKCNVQIIFKHNVTYLL